MELKRWGDELTGWCGEECVCGWVDSEAGWIMVRFYTSDWQRRIGGAASFVAAYRVIAVE